MAQRLTRKLTDVAREVEQQIKAHYNVTQKELDAWRNRARASQHQFPESKMVAIADLWIDYEVQRDVLHKHIINIIKKWDSRICSPVSACRLTDTDRIDTYDGQHRTISATILGFEEIPGAVVVTDDKNFASYAFEMLNDTGVKRLNPGDLHRNALVRYKNGSRDIKNVPPIFYALFRPSVQPYLRSWFSLNPVTLAQAIKSPVLIVQGTADIQVSKEDAQLLQSAFINNRTVWLKNTNHVLTKSKTLNKTQQMTDYTDVSQKLPRKLKQELKRYIKLIF